MSDRPITNLNWKNLEGFYRVVFARGFRRAEEIFGISASALHQRISRLEEELDLMLLDRSNPKKICPSRAGRVLYDFSAPFFEGIEHTVREARGESGGVLRISSTPAIMQNCLAQPLGTFYRRHSRVEVVVEERPWMEVVELVSRGRVDLGFAPAPPKGHDLEYEPIYDSDFFLICSKKHPILKVRGLTLARIAEENIVFFPPESASGNRIRARFEGAGILLRPSVTTHNVGTIQRYVAEGFGVGIVSGVSLPPPSVRRFEARSIGRLLGSISQGVMWRADRHLGQLAQAFLEFLPR
ncbi:MAG: LysR family transcriptional regulator substrate-binding protein [Planctomycetota bacterium]|jgi:DNA-binding transcriptional LysR family regulator|nr:LysR family transcriptional regulator substrate-binding protein [Planctomycetota bacterium]